MSLGAPPRGLPRKGLLSWGPRSSPDKHKLGFVPSQNWCAQAETPDHASNLELCRSETQNLWLSVRATELDQSLQLGCCSDQTGQICETSWGGRRPGAGLSVHWRALAVQGGAATEPHPMAATPTVAMLQWDLVMADPAIFQQKVETSILILE